MFRPRIIPVLLLKNRGLVKSVGFSKHRYIGDPINAVKIFNDLKADELVFLDILASKENRTLSTDFVKNVGEEANMPFAVGGGINSIGDIKKLIGAGAEKVVISTSAIKNPDFIRQASEIFGSSTVTVCIDVKRNLFKKETVMICSGTRKSGIPVEESVLLFEELGAGEIIIQSIDNDGTMEGYDLPLIKKVSDLVKIPVVALGGAGSLAHLEQAFAEANASGLAAGSLFVYHGPRRGILINYPDKNEIATLFH